MVSTIVGENRIIGEVSLKLKSLFLYFSNIYSLFLTKNLYIFILKIFSVYEQCHYQGFYRIILG